MMWFHLFLQTFFKPSNFFVKIIGIWEVSLVLILILSNMLTSLHFAANG